MLNNRSTTRRRVMVFAERLPRQCTYSCLRDCRSQPLSPFSTNTGTISTPVFRIVLLSSLCPPPYGGRHLSDQIYCTSSFGAASSAPASTRFGFHNFRG